MKLFDAIVAEQRSHAAPVTRFAIIDAKHEVEPSKIPNHYQWRISVSIGCTFSGPINARDRLVQEGTRLIAKEVYGELMDDLIELQYILMQEQYRAPDDPALDAIHNMLRKMRGADA